MVNGRSAHPGNPSTGRGRKALSLCSSIVMQVNARDRRSGGEVAENRDRQKKALHSRVTKNELRASEPRPVEGLPGRGPSAVPMVESRISDTAEGPRPGNPDQAKGGQPDPSLAALSVSW